MYIPAPTLKYKVVSNGALPSAVRPSIEYGIAQLLNREQFSTAQKRFGKRITTRKTKIAGTNWNPNKIVQWELDVKAMSVLPAIPTSTVSAGLATSQVRMGLAVVHGK